MTLAKVAHCAPDERVAGHFNVELGKVGEDARHPLLGV